MIAKILNRGTIKIYQQLYLFFINSRKKATCKLYFYFFSCVLQSPLMCRLLSTEITSPRLIMYLVIGRDLELDLDSLTLYYDNVF